MKKKSDDIGIDGFNSGLLLFGSFFCASCLIFAVLFSFKADINAVVIFSLIIAGLLTIVIKAALKISSNHAIGPAFFLNFLLLTSALLPLFLINFSIGFARCLAWSALFSLIVNGLMRRSTKDENFKSALFVNSFVIPLSVALVIFIYLAMIAVDDSGKHVEFIDGTFHLLFEFFYISIIWGLVATYLQKMKLGSLKNFCFIVIAIIIAYSIPWIVSFFL